MRNVTNFYRHYRNTAVCKRIQRSFVNRQSENNVQEGKPVQLTDAGLYTLHL